MSDPEDDPALDPQGQRVDAEGGPNVEAMNFWDEIVSDMEATAAEYEQQGWDTLQLHPGDVAVLPGETPEGDRVEKFGIDVLVPDNEFEDVEAMLGRGVAFDTYEVFKAEVAGMVYLLVAMEDTDEDAAMLYPAYYQVSDPDTTTLFDRAREEGVLYSFVRRLDDRQVQLRHDDPTLFEPPEESEE